MNTSSESTRRTAARLQILAVLLLVSGAVRLAAQEKVNFNEVYRFPASVGVCYQTLSPFGDYQTEFTSYYDLSAILRVPIPKLPVLQPLLRGGMIRFLTPEAAEQAKWEHTHWYLTGGLGYASRFTKNFEIGLDAAAGLSEAVFPNLDPDETRGSANFVALAGARITLNPSFNLSIDINPGLLYFHSLSPLDRFNGFVYGIGFSGHYRFGDDPDAPQAIIRSVKLSDFQFPPLFAAMQSYYAKKPFGRLTITNVEKFPIYDVAVSFFQAGYMDNPTALAAIPELPAGEGSTVDIVASFNKEIFNTAGIVPLTGEVTVEYVSRRKPAKQTFSISYDLYDKRSLTWDDDRKVGAFITAADSALRNYASFVRQAAKDFVMPAFSEPLQVAVQVFYALKEIGCIYQVDPTSAFATVQENPLIVDSISLPRDTLKSLTGDCDDLTVLYCSLLEAVGIETAFVTVPGHIYAAFNTKVPAKSYSRVHPDKDMSLNINGELWVPVEITMIGTHDFHTAWRTGIEEFAALAQSPERRGIHLTAQSQEVYRPVGLQEEDLGLQYGNAKNIVEGFRSSIDKLTDQIIESCNKAAQQAGNKDAYNRLGIACAQYGRYPQAQRAFNTALSLDRNFVGAQINLGNVHYLKEEYQDALRVYHNAEEMLRVAGQESSPLYAGVLLNISRAYYQLENYDRAAEYFERLTKLDASAAEQYSYLAARQPGGRAGLAPSRFSIRFAGEEE